MPDPEVKTLFFKITNLVFDTVKEHYGVEHFTEIAPADFDGARGGMRRPST